MTRPPGRPPRAVPGGPHDPWVPDYRVPGLPRMPGPSPDLLYQPVYPASREPLPPRRRQPRSSPFVAPVLALLGLLLVGGASAWAVSFLGVDLAGAAGEPSATPVDELVAIASLGPDASRVHQPCPPSRWRPPSCPTSWSRPRTSVPP